MKNNNRVEKNEKKLNFMEHWCYMQNFWMITTILQEINPDHVPNISYINRDFMT